MNQDIIQELAFGLKLDNALCATECAEGQILPTEEILSLAATAGALYLSVTLESRSIGKIDTCHDLWSGAAQLFSELCDAWIPADKTEALNTHPDLRWLKTRLEHFRSCARDRVELYAVNENARARFAKTKDLGWEEDTLPARPVENS